jgi:kynurenine formamidase
MKERFGKSKRMLGASIGSIACAATIVLLAGVSSAPPARGQGAVTTETLLQWVEDFAKERWGRWNNQLAAANFITDKKRMHATKLVTKGISVSLAHPLLTIPFDPAQPFLPTSGTPPIGPIATPNIAPLPTVPRDPDNGNPFFHWMNPNGFTSDRYNVSYHGTAHSHLDALCHYPLLGVIFDGITTAANNTGNTTAAVGGCAKYGINNLRDGVLTKGVLFDATLLPHLLEPGYNWLAPGTHVHRSDLEALEKIQHVKVESGDVILLYTGRWARRAALGPWPTSGTPTPAGVGVAGYDADAMSFVFEREVSFIGHDEWNDAFPNGYPGFPNNLPVHTLAIRVLGVDIFDNLDLERLAATARQLGRYEFMFTAAPMNVTGGTGSPLNPLAVF